MNPFIPTLEPLECRCLADAGPYTPPYLAGLGAGPVGGVGSAQSLPPRPPMPPGVFAPLMVGVRLTPTPAVAPPPVPQLHLPPPVGGVYGPSTPPGTFQLAFPPYVPKQ